MKKLYLIIFLLTIGLRSFLHSKEVKTDTFFERVNTLSTQEIIRLGDNYQKESDTAIALYSISNRRYNENMSEEEKQLCVSSFLKTGDAYYKQGNYTNAFDHYIQGLKICESCHNKERLPDIYLKLGSVYCTFLDYEMGISYFERAYQLSQTYPNKKREYSLLANLAGAHNYLNNIEEAKKYYYLSKSLTQPGDTLKNYMNLLNWGLILVNEKKYASAIQTFHQSAAFAKKYQMEPRYECSSYEELYKTYQLTGNNDSTLYYLKRCNILAQENGLANVLIQSLKAYSDLYEKIGKLQNSLFYKGKYLALADSIFNVREFNRVKHTQSIYEMEKTNKEISYLNAEKEQKEAKIKMQRKVLLGILIGFLSISGFLLFVYYQKRKLSQAYKNLFIVNLEIIASDHYNKTLRLQYEEKLNTAYKALEKYQNKKQTLPERKSDVDNSIFAENLEKYQSSNLANEHKQALLESINHIMEATDEYCKEDFSLEKLATLVNSNSKYVSQAINETYHKNFNIYLNEYRIQEARIRLADVEKYGNYTIKAIAESVGYKSTTTFTNAFKNITGITPSIFQKMAKEDKNKKCKVRTIPGE